MKQQHYDIDEKSYSKGIKSDVNAEILGASGEEGSHIDSVNMRSLSMDGHNFAKKKIKGEELLYFGVDNRCIGGTGLPLSNTYLCMSVMEIQNHIIEIWADTDALSAPFIRVDGKIVLQSNDFPIYVTHPIQCEKNENCVGGEMYITNNLTPPMVFSLKDLMLNSGMDYSGQIGVCTDKYFDGFLINEYTVSVSSSLYKPAFIETVEGFSGTYSSVIGTSGIPVGSYSYSYRYVTTDGDRTSWSPITELIPVVRSQSNSFATFPSIRTYGDEPDISNPTAYGNHIRIRYDNALGFEFIEVRRDSWYNGDGIGSAPVSEIIGSVQIEPNIVSVLDILDRTNAEEAQEIITLDEQTAQMSSINRAKTLRYYNERLYLMNIGYNSKDINDAVDFIDPDNPSFPTIEKIGQKGHKSTYNSTYYKSNMRGEKISTAVILYDESNNFSYAKKIEDNFTFPNRRDKVSIETLTTSYKGVVQAADVDNQISFTHEVFDHENAIDKNDNVIANILERGDREYQPFNPVSQTDSNGDELVQNVNIAVGINSLANSDTYYSPKAFGLDYYSIGYTFKGFDTINKPIPNWVSGFSVVQSEPAKRVIAQGMGYYRLENTGGTFRPNGGKATDEFYVYFPDLDTDTGLYPQVIDSLLNDSTGYKLQLVSPLGFFTECYSFLNNVGNDDALDLITYNRVLRENGAINPTANALNSGYNGYTGYGKWINPTNNTLFNGVTNGNEEFNIIDIEEVITDSGVSKYLKIKLDRSFYAEWGGNGFIDSSDTSVKEWQEPMYVVNLIKSDAQVVNGLTTQYKYTGHYIKMNSDVATVTTQMQTGFSTPLVSERWEDCVPKLTVNTFAGWNLYDYYKRFVFVKDSNGVERRWLNVTYETAAYINQVLSDIATNGYALIFDAVGSYNVYGVYKNSESLQSSGALIVNLDFYWFNQAFPVDLMIPPANSRVVVKYDNRIPVRVFGGDTYINESIWAVKDIRYDKNANIVNPSEEFKIELAFPYSSYTLSGGIQILNNPALVSNWIQDERTMRFGRGTAGASIRQLISVWTAETRTNLSFAFNNEDTLHSLDQFFPLKNYVMRPYKWQDGQFDNGASAVYADNHIFADYETDYGDEFNNWGMGGFRFRPQTNIDYSKNQNTLLITSVPTVGFDEQTDFCTRILWSEKRPINAQNTPTVRTFPAGNFYDISDDTGEIKKAFSAISSDKGNNLYAFTDSGVCLLMVDKRVISEINGNELATSASDIGGILNQIWIDKTIGMDDETWRSCAEYSNTLFYTNNVSSYMFKENQLVDIALSGYKERLNKEFIPMIGKEYDNHLTGGYDVLHQEYIVSFRPDNVSRNRPETTLIFGVQQGALQCRSSYDYDQYLYINNLLYGMKNANTYLLDSGNQINGQDIVASLAGVSDKQAYFDKEFLRIRVNSNVKPEQIEFYDSYENYIAGVPSSIVDAVAVPLSIKDYYGYECYIPRKMLAPYGRQQGRVLIFNIKNSNDENFLVTSTGVQYKTLK